MSSPSPGQIFNTHGLGKVPRRVFNRVRDAMHPRALPGISAANIPNDAPGVVRPVQDANKVGETPGVVGNRSQDAILPTLRPSSQQPSSHPELNTSNKLKKAWGVKWSALETALRLLAKSADVFPPLKSVVCGLVACLDLAQVGYGYGCNVLCLV